jgi:hypothetical protein
MAVTLIFSPTISGVSYANALEGGGQGISFGNVVNGEFAPMTSKINNTGHMDVYLHHNAVTEPVNNVVLFLQSYGTSTGFTYGGQRSAVSDFTQFLALGSVSGSYKNNLDGLSGGLWCDMDADASTVNQFDHANFPSLVKIFGKADAGSDLLNGIQIGADSLVYDSSGEQIATTPVAGSIGVPGDTVKGDNAHLKFRIYLPTSWEEGGNYQCELACAYRYTA